MIEFLRGSELWANIIGGVVTAILISLGVFLWNQRKHWILKELIEIMGKAIEHRNAGEHQAFTDQKEWVEKAKAIEAEAIAKAKKLSPAAGSFVEWLDRVPPYDPTNEVDKYVSILNKLIERIRELMELNSKE